MNTILGQKQEQTQRFLENGTRIPVTVFRVLDNAIVAIKTMDKDAYIAVQLGVGSAKNPNKPRAGHAKKAHLSSTPSLLREVRLTADSSVAQGDMLSVAQVLKAGDIIQVTGISKGKGFAGGVKRYGFRGGPRTHGQSDRERAPGSIGQTTTPGRVYKGKHMAGRMGQDQVTVRNLMVVAVDDVNKQVLVKGLVPGGRGTWITMTKTGEVNEKKYVPLLQTPEELQVAQAEAAKIAAEAPQEAAVNEEPKVEEANEPEVAPVAEVEDDQPVVAKEEDGTK